MKKKIMSIVLLTALLGTLSMGCAARHNAPPPPPAPPGAPAAPAAPPQ